MSGFHDSIQRRSRPPNSQMLDVSLQQGTSSFQPGPRNPRSEFSESRGSNRSSFDSQESSNPRDFDSRRLASRIPAGRDCRMTIQKAVGFIFADDNPE